MLSDELRDRLDAWVRLVAPRATAYARSLVRDFNVADDIVQECLFRLLRHATNYALERDGVLLLFRAISNLSINLGTRQREIATLGGDQGEEPIPVEDKLARLPHDVLIGEELQERIGQAIANLPPMQRAALELRALGQGKGEIANILEVSESHAGVLVHRARKTVAEEIAPFLNQG